MSQPDEYLEREYNARASIPDHPEIFSRWAADSAAVRARLDGRIDLRYGDGPRATLDLFPAASPDAPMMAFIHGGYWRSLDKSDFSFLVPTFRQAGFSVAMIRYDLAPTVRIAAIVEQCRRALEWLHAHAAAHACSARELHLAGHSAGAHLVAMQFATDWEARGSAAVGDSIRGGIALSGLYELAPLLLTTMQQDLRLDDAEIEAVSPGRRMPTVAAPLLLAVGEHESRAFRQQSNALAERWPVCREPRIVAGAHHLSIVDQFADPASGLLAGYLERS